MLGLGKVVKTPSDLMIIDVYTFHLVNMTWSLITLRAEFQVASVHFDEGGFRRAYIHCLSQLFNQNENNLKYSSLN